MDRGPASSSTRDARPPVRGVAQAPARAPVQRAGPAKILFGSDYPVIHPEKWIEEFDKLPIKPEVRPKIMKENAAKLLRL